MEKLIFSYTLTEKEVYDGLRLSGVYRTSGKRAVIETVLLAVFFVFFVVSYVWQPGAFNLVMAAVTLAVLLAVNLVPRMDMKKQAKQCHRDVKLRLTQDRLFLETGAGAQTVLLDGSSEIKVVGRKGEQQLVIFLAGGGLLVLPVRAIPQEMRGQALSILLRED